MGVFFDAIGELSKSCSSDHSCWTFGSRADARCRRALPRTKRYRDEQDDGGHGREAQR
jgi:hypothetical protein